MDDMMQQMTEPQLSSSDGNSNARAAVADAFDRTANRLHDTADGSSSKRVSAIADRTANALDATGRYVRDMSTRDVVDDLKTVAKNHPGKAMMAAAGIGFLVGRALMRSDD